MNRFRQTNYTPYELADEKGRIGCYRDIHTAQSIGRSKLINKQITRYVVRDIEGRICDEG